MVSIVRREDGIVVISVRGELDVASTHELTPYLDKLATDRSAKVVVELSELTFIDSGGLNALVLAARAMEGGGGSFVVAGPTPQVKRVFEIVQLPSQVAIEDSLEAALHRVVAVAEA